MMSKFVVEKKMMMDGLVDFFFLKFFIQFCEVVVDVCFVFGVGNFWVELNVVDREVFVFYCFDGIGFVFG